MAQPSTDPAEELSPLLKEHVSNAYVDPDAYEPGEPVRIPKSIRKALKCGDFGRIRARNWRKLDVNDMTTAEKVMHLIESAFRVPSGMLVGQPLRLLLFQELIVYTIFDLKPEVFVLSMARRNGKTMSISIVVLVYMISWLSEQNAEICSSAMSRDQAALVHKEIERVVLQSPTLQRLIHSQSSLKRLTGIASNVIYQALSADAKTGYGRGYKVVVLDECGQIVGPDNDYIGMLRTSQGSINDPLFVAISTQAPSDSDYLSVLIDTSIREQPDDTIVWLFAAEPNADLDDEQAWIDANPGLGIYRSVKDLKKQVRSAKAIPQQEARFRNLSLNQRVSSQGLWLGAEIWSRGRTQPDEELFRGSTQAVLALDLSMKTDLTAAVFGLKDKETEQIHLLPFAFAPQEGVAMRAMRDKVDYEQMAKEGFLHLTPGSVVSYKWVIQFLAMVMRRLEFEPAAVAFDRWRINDFKQHADLEDFCIASDWRGIGQGYKDMSPRIEAFEGQLMEGRIRHGSHPLLNLGAGQAIATKDPSGNRKLDKSKSNQRIDVLVAAVMASVEAESVQAIDIDGWIIS